MAHFEPPHEDLCRLQIQLFATLVFKGIRKVSQTVVPLFNGFMALLCNYLYGMGHFL